MKNRWRQALPAILAATWLLGLSGVREEARAQATYVPSAPEPDSVPFRAEGKKDPRVAPRDAHNWYPTSPYVPKNQPAPWVSNDYFQVPVRIELSQLLTTVEHAHLGPKNNPRGFWPRYIQGRYETAFSELQFVLWAFPNHPRALQLLGMVARQTEQPYVPIAYYEKALRLFPDRAYTRAQYGAYLVEIGETTQGILQLEQALHMDPSLLMARAWLDKAKRSIGLEVGESAPVTGGELPQPDGIYVPRR